MHYRVGPLVDVTQNGSGIGLRANSLGSDAVQGNANAESGLVFGVRGTTNSTEGIGVQGTATKVSGTTVGVLGRVFSSTGIAGVFDNAGGGKILSGQVSGIEHFSVDGNGNVTLSSIAVPIDNETVTGTTLHRLAKLTGAPSKAIIAATTDTGGVVGIVIAGAGTSGSATVALTGGADCDFDNATTAGDYVQISSTAAGKCHDVGATYPRSGQVLGRVLATNGAPGTNSIGLSGPEIRGGPSPAILSGSCSGTATSSSDGIKLFGLGQIGVLTCTFAGALSDVPMPSAGVLKNLRVVTGTGGVNGSSGVFSVLVNNGVSSITCTLGTGTTCSDTAHTAAVAAGDVVAVIFTTQASETLANVRVTLEKVP